MILPYNLNVIHYFADTNNYNCLGEALAHKGKYMKDMVKKWTPLNYAMSKKSFESTQLLIEYIMQSESIYNTIS